MKDEISLIELQNKIHAQNKKMGWWDEVRSYKTIASLIHSELSEAMEGDRKDLMDDHLSHYKMFWVELADFSIRCFDYLGYVKNKEYDFYIDNEISNSEFICDMHSQVSSFVNNMNDPYYRNTDVPQKQLAYAVMSCFHHADSFNIDLHKIIIEKVEYNKHRPDHKKENRKKEGGKKY